jgi:hypothetical protein
MNVIEVKVQGIEKNDQETQAFLLTRQIERFFQGTHVQVKVEFEDPFNPRILYDVRVPKELNTAGLADRLAQGAVEVKVNAQYQIRVKGFPEDSAEVGVVQIAVGVVMGLSWPFSDWFNHTIEIPGDGENIAVICEFIPSDEQQAAIRKWIGQRGHNIREFSLTFELQKE